MKQAAIASVTLASMGIASAIAEETAVWAYLESDPGEKTAMVAYSTCNDDVSWSECVSHSIGCRAKGDAPSGNLPLTYFLGLGDGGRLTAKLVASAREGSDDQGVRITFLLRQGRLKYDVVIDRLIIDWNYMNGAFDAELQGDELAGLVEVITDANLSQAKVEIAGTLFELVPHEGDADKLLAMKKVCEPSQ